MAHLTFFVAFLLWRELANGWSPESIVLPANLLGVIAGSDPIPPLPDGDRGAMSSDTIHGSGEPPGSGDSVAGREVCRYLDTVSTLERLTGFDRRAAFFSIAANECPRRKCRFEPLCRALDAERPPRNPTANFLTAVAFPPPSAGHRPAWGGAEPVAFARATAIEMIDDGLGNRVERRTLKLDVLKAASSLNYLFGYWRWLRRATACRLADMDVLQIMRARIIGRLHIVDVRSSDPGDFRYDLAGGVVPFKVPSRPSALPVAIYADATVRDYNTVRFTGVPRVQRIRAHLEGVCCHYTRLILPFLGETRRVSHLVVAIEQEPGDGMRLAPVSSPLGRER
jgi:hypothetical protein